MTRLTTSIVPIMTELLGRSEGSEWRVQNRFAWRTEGNGKVDHLSSHFVEDETMDKNVKGICRGLGVCLGQETVIMEFPHTAFDTFLYKGTKTS